MIMAARSDFIAGASGMAELTATVQSCIGLWESGFAMADVDGTPLLNRRTMALIGRAVAVRGEALFLIKGDKLVPCVDWDITTIDTEPRAYRVNLSEAGTSYSTTALAAEVLHLRTGCSPASPWTGTSPLRRASLSAGLLDALESALSEVFALGPLGSQIVPFPESKETDLESLSRGFRGRRGRVLLRESVVVSAAGGPAPSQDWKPQDVTPDLSRSTARETLQLAQHAIASVYGVTPGLLNAATTGPMIREAQRHLATWTLQPLAALLAEEATAKLGGPVTIDTLRPLQAYDVSGRARALATIVQALASAKEAGIDGAALGQALSLVNWKDGADG